MIIRKCDRCGHDIPMKTGTIINIVTEHNINRDLCDMCYAGFNTFLTNKPVGATHYDDD